MLGISGSSVAALELGFVLSKAALGVGDFPDQFDGNFIASVGVNRVEAFGQSVDAVLHDGDAFFGSTLGRVSEDMLHERLMVLFSVGVLVRAEVARHEGNIYLGTPNGKSQNSNRGMDHA